MYNYFRLFKGGAGRPEFHAASNVKQAYALENAQQQPGALQKEMLCG